MAKPKKQETVDPLRVELQRIARSGFPVTDESAGKILTEQRVVVATAQHPDERASRISALERVLRDILKGFGSSTKGQAARIIFAADRGYQGTNLAHRQQAAARIVELSSEHVRQFIQPKILDEIVLILHQENLRYTPKSAKTRPEIGVTADMPTITTESVTEQQEMSSRVWSAVYGFRAEIIAMQRRLPEVDEDASVELAHHIGAAKWQLARLLTFVWDYMDKFGEEILDGEIPHNVEGLVALAGWSGGIDSAEAKHLRYTIARSGLNSLKDFLNEAR
jgi:hypothetical protein